MGIRERSPRPRERRHLRRGWVHGIERESTQQGCPMAGCLASTGFGRGEFARGPSSHSDRNSQRQYRGGGQLPRCVLASREPPCGVSPRRPDISRPSPVDYRVPGRVGLARGQRDGVPSDVSVASKWIGRGRRGSPSLHLADVSVEAAGVYDCVVSNSCGDSLTNPATLTIASRQIVAPPSDQHVNVDQPVFFTIETDVSSPCDASLAFQWQRRNPLVENPDAPGSLDRSRRRRRLLGDAISNPGHPAANTRPCRRLPMHHRERVRLRRVARA